MDEQLAPLKTEVVELKAELQEMNKFLEFTNTKYEEIWVSLSKHEQEQKEIVEENKILKSTVQVLEASVKRMQESINDMEQYSQRECIEIKGVPLPDVNTGREDTDNHVMKIGKLMGVNIEHKDISVSHRTS